MLHRSERAAARAIAASVAVIGWTYAGYPVALKALAGQARRKLLPASLPTVTVLIPAFNEERFIAKKVLNSLSLDYPEDLVDVLVVDDGSTDATAELARQEGARVVTVTDRGGKSNAINVGMRSATGDIVVLTDANGSLSDDAIRAIVAEFDHPDVAVVSGAKAPQGAGARGGGEKAYWRYENSLKEAEGRLGCTVGADGGIYAVRRCHWRPIPVGTLGDDFEIPLMALSNGLRVGHTSAARATEMVSNSVRDEFERRTRISAGIWQGIVRHPELVNPRRGRVALAFISHRVLRTAVVPLSLPLVFAATVFLARRQRWARWFLALQATAMAAAAGGGAMDHRALSVPYQFGVTNVGALRGAMRFFRGRQATTWKRASRGDWVA
jgi:poly-beta-1,6-N-acetyl-D-glucosamine synthase